MEGWVICTWWGWGQRGLGGGGGSGEVEGRAKVEDKQGLIQSEGIDEYVWYVTLTDSVLMIFQNAQQLFFDYEDPN